MIKETTHSCYKRKGFIRNKLIRNNSQTSKFQQNVRNFQCIPTQVTVYLVVEYGQYLQ